MMINRFQISYAKDRLFNGKALIIYGPRQVGKTTFVDLLLQNIKGQKVLSLNGDDSDTRELLSNPNVTLLQSIIGDNTLLFIDEAQRIDNIGILIKIIVDRIKSVQVIATGSSSFELANHINEPLTGRKYEMLLLPFSFQELVSDSDLITEKRKLNEQIDGFDAVGDDEMVVFLQSAIKQWEDKEKALKLLERVTGLTELREIDKQAHIKIVVQKATTYSIYTQIHNEIEEAVNILRNDKCKELFGEKYTVMNFRYNQNPDENQEDKDKLDLIKILYPGKIIEVEPKN